MLGIEDISIWGVYMLSFICLCFSIIFGIRNWNKDTNLEDKINSENVPSIVDSLIEE